MTDLQPNNVAAMWIRRARSDLLLGEVAIRTPGVMLEDTCFHAQQCADFSDLSGAEDLVANIMAEWLL